MESMVLLGIAVSTDQGHELEHMQVGIDASQIRCHGKSCTHASSQIVIGDCLPGAQGRGAGNALAKTCEIPQAVCAVERAGVRKATPTGEIRKFALCAPLPPRVSPALALGPFPLQLAPTGQHREFVPLAAGRSQSLTKSCAPSKERRQLDRSSHVICIPWNFHSISSPLTLLPSTQVKEVRQANPPSHIPFTTWILAT
jgi:hypothetical protein